MSAPVELHKIEKIQRQVREVLDRRSLPVPVREKWEVIMRRVEWCADVVTGFRERCHHCFGGGRITRPPLRDCAGRELNWPQGHPRQTTCPYCRGSGLLDRPDEDGDAARWEPTVNR